MMEGGFYWTCGWLSTAPVSPIKAFGAKNRPHLKLIGPKTARI